MDGDKPPRLARRADVLKKLNADSLLAIERGLLGDLPDKLKPQPAVPVRGRPTDLVMTKPTGILSACLPTAPDSPGAQNSSEDEGYSPLKKSFSFRDKLTRLSFLRKDKEKKWKPLAETDSFTLKENADEPPTSPIYEPKEFDFKSNKRFWFFRNKEIERRNKDHVPIYKRSKSFEFLPKALEEEDKKNKQQMDKTLDRSSVFASSETMGDAWTSNDSLEFMSPPIRQRENTVSSLFNLQSITECEPGHSGSSRDCSSSASTLNSTSSGIYMSNLLKSDSMQCVFDEFQRAVEMFSEAYLSDSELYTRTEKVPLKEKRKSSSFSTLPSPKIVHVNPIKVCEVSEDFKKELSLMLSDKKKSVVQRALGGKTARRGSATDWFVLEEPAAGAGRAAASRPALGAAEDKYRRALKKPTNRVRRMSSTKYWITPEECAVYSREHRPPLVIPRITHYRARQERAHNTHGYSPEECGDLESLTSSRRDGTDDWSPASERRYDPRLDSPTPLRTRGKTSYEVNEPAVSSSGESLDVELRERAPKVRGRKARSLLAGKRKEPLPLPRTLLPAVPAVDSNTAPRASIVHEGPVKRTKFSVNGRKCKKNWVDCYMVLSHTALIFYKDQRTFQARSPGAAGAVGAGGAGGRAELVLALRGAQAVPALQMHTRRYQRSLLLMPGFDHYLVQDDSELSARRWLHLIQNQIYKLGPPCLAEFPPEEPAAPDDERHDAAHLRQKDEQVFGRRLEDVCPRQAPRVPVFVTRCIAEIERSEDNMKTDGLYRASGNLSQVQKIRLEVDQERLEVLAECGDVHVLAGALKLFFRELKEPLIPCSFFARILAAPSLRPASARAAALRELVRELPAPNRDTLRALLSHLLRVTSFSSVNRMTPANLAIVFGPTLLWAPPAPGAHHNLALDCYHQNNVVDALLTHYHEIFD